MRGFAEYSHRLILSNHPVAILCYVRKYYDDFLIVNIYSDVRGNHNFRQMLQKTRKINIVLSEKCEPLIINPRRACAARVTVLGLSVYLSVCLSVRRLANLAVQGTGRPMTATNRFRVARSLILIGRLT